MRFINIRTEYLHILLKAKEMNKVIVCNNFSKQFPIPENNGLYVSRVAEEKTFSNMSDENFGYEQIIETVVGNDFENNTHNGSFSNKSLDSPATPTGICKDDQISITDSSSSEYEIVAVNVKNMTKTTVINTTYNMSHSTLSDTFENGIKEKCIQNDQKSVVQTDTLEKSRVVVQVLSSSKKSEKQLLENINRYDYPSTHNFRDEVFKILSKNESSVMSNSTKNHKELNICQAEKLNIDNINKYNNSTHNFGTDVLKILSKNQSAISNIPENGKSLKQVERLSTIDEPKKECPELNKTGALKKHPRKPKLKFCFRNGSGIKIRDITFVASNLRTASPRLLRILHYVLFDSYGPCNTGLQLLKTKRNIMNFCGYPFNKNSDRFEKKKNCLLKLPLPILTEMYTAIIANGLGSRSEMVSDLMEFFLKPLKRESHSENNDEKDQALTMEELKQLALRTPLPTVVINRLTESDIEKIQHKIKLENSLETDIDDHIPVYIFKGPGQKLKSFSAIADNIQTAQSKIIKVLHYILYGKIELIEDCRKNILQFSGFKSRQDKFTAERKKLLSKLSQDELFQICKIFCLHDKTNSRAIKIKKIMQYLCNPTDPVPYRYFVRKKDKIKSEKIRPQNPPRCSRLKSKHSKVLNFIRKKDKKKSDKIHPQNRPNCSRLKSKYSKVLSIQEAKNTSCPKLRDFTNICYKIECAAPSDLTELNDLLFVQPCDESEIHQRILDFAGFNFLINSMDYHYRKTLMHYMNFCIIQKVAGLLDIRDLDKFSNQDELADTILNFLMEMKLPDLHKKVVHFKLPENTSQNSEVKENKSETVNTLQVCNQSLKKLLTETVSTQTSQNENLDLDCLYSSDEKAIQKYESNDKSVMHYKKEVVIHRLSKTPAQMQINENHNGFISSTDNSDDDLTPLRTYLHHPSDHELHSLIKNILEANLWTFTMKDLIQKIYHLYPDFNLKYREDFIKTEARQILTDMRSNAVDTLNHLHFTKTDYLL